ncbi:hypothetical protein [Streptomyces sp. NPDC002619]|uniref:hypothetical protein n=1 Tax=Streptomyces sp. NPDC002619 TaxID=3364655 RepID=UPI0036B417A8
MSDIVNRPSSDDTSLSRLIGALGTLAFWPALIAYLWLLGADHREDGRSGPLAEAGAPALALGVLLTLAVTFTPDKRMQKIRPWLVALQYLLFIGGPVLVALD